MPFGAERNSSYKATWNKVQKWPAGGHGFIIDIQSGEGKFTQNESGSLEGFGKEYFLISLAEALEPGQTEVQPRQGEGEFRASGITSEDGIVNIDITLDSFELSASRTVGPGDAWSWAPAVTMSSGVATLKFPVGEASFQNIEFNRGRPFTHMVNIVPRSEE